MAVLNETTHAIRQHPSDEGRTVISLTHGSLVYIDHSHAVARRLAVSQNSPP